jgi:DNA topoisomerase-3
MRLFIAEKPSVARALAGELGHGSNGDGFIQCDSDTVTWCFGHILEMAEPHEYDPKYKTWRDEDLPIVPTTWKILPKPDAKRQLDAIGRLMKQASTIVNAGDPDREGQLLVDEVLHHFGNRLPVSRLWISAVDSVSIQRGLTSLRDNREFRGLTCAALARGRADWLVGMNLSRAYTLRSRRAGRGETLTVGRVQTPTLALVVARDREIEAFVPKPFQILWANFQHTNGPFRGKWVPPEDSPGLDPDGRLVDPSVGAAVIQSVAGKPGLVTSYETKPKREPPPLAWSLTTLTTKASAAYSYGADEVLKGAQSLYDQKLTSYPRTDCDYLPESQHADAPAVLASVGSMRKDLANILKHANPNLKSRTWNDGKVTAHHGIIPTQHRGDISKLNEIERSIYDLIVRSYIAQFFPNHEFLETKVVATVSGHHFSASGKVITHQGWKVLLQDEPEEESDEKEPVQTLPQMKQKDQVQCLEAIAKNSMTKPPKRFTEGTLIRAMENIDRFVTDPEHKKILKEGDGIGTPATRATILGDLKRREFLAPRGKAIVSTKLGQSLVDQLADEVKSPVLTALYERKLREVEACRIAVPDFVADVAEMVGRNLLLAREALPPPTSADGIICPQCGKGLLGRRKGKNGFFWGCSQYEAGCKATYEDNRNKPALTPKKGYACPACKHGTLKLRRGPKGPFWGCSCYPECRGAAPDNNGKPLLEPTASQSATKATSPKG